LRCEVMRLCESLNFYDLVNDINAAAEREKGPGRPPIWEMVFWWTRKPLIGARAAIVASLLPEDIDMGPNYNDLRKLLRLDSKSPHRENPMIGEKYAGYIVGKKLLDPFAGFGSIPLEGLRLGLDVTACELLPTAYVFLKAVLEYPKWAVEKGFGNLLLEEVERWGREIVKQLKADKDIRELYDDTAAAYIGSWEIVCPNCGRRTPLVGNWWLARVKGKEGYERLAFFRPFKVEGEVKIEVVDLGKNVKAEVDARTGIIRIAGKEYRVPAPNVVARSQTARCLMCEMPIKADREWYVKEAIKEWNENLDRYFSGEISLEQLLNSRARPVILIKVRADGDLVFEPAGKEETEKLWKAAEKLRQMWGDPDIPTEPLAGYERRQLMVCTSTGACKWFKLFNPRQLLTLVKLVKLIREVGKRVEQEKVKEGLSKEEAFKYAEAVTTYLTMILLKFADYSSLTAGWNQSLIMGHSLSMRGIAMVWNWDEIVPWANWTGTYERNLQTSTEALSYLISAVATTFHRLHVLLDDTTLLSKLDPNQKFDLIVTDPPYRDDVPYTELSDFYYVWLKRALSDADEKLKPRFLPEAFFRKIGAKYVEIETQWQEFAKREVSYNKGRFSGSGENALENYRNLMAEALKRMKEHLAEDGIITLYFAHTSFEAWAELLEALNRAGLKLVWASRFTTESAQRVTARGKMTLDTSLLIACRPREGDAEIPIEKLKEEAREKAEKVARYLVSKYRDRKEHGRDILLGTMVAAISVATKYSRVRTPGGPIGMEELLEKHIYPLVGKVLSEVYAREFQAEELRDPYALFYLLAKVAFSAEGKTAAFTRDDVVTLCRASALPLKDAKELLIDARKAEGEEEEELESEGSKVAQSKNVKLIEITSDRPEEIRKILAKKKLSLDVPMPRNAVDAYHYLLYFASLYPADRVRLEYEKMNEKYDFVKQAFSLAKIIANIKDGVEKTLAVRVVNALEISK
jgi:putative DNA methylase